MQDIADKMKGVVLLGHGGSDMLAYRHDLPVPQPQIRPRQPKRVLSIFFTLSLPLQKFLSLARR